VRKPWWFVVLVLMALPAAWADTIVTTDGRRLTGDVTKTKDGYVVKTKGIATTIPAGQVKEWIKEASPASSSAANPSTSAPSPTPRPTSPTTVAPAGAPQQPQQQRWSAALGRWTTHMQDALAAGELLEARSLALDVLDVDPDNVRAWHALALTYVGTRELSKAADAIEKAMEKTRGSPDRALVLNFAMIMISNRNPMRAARFLLDHLQDRQKEPVDETLLNALAVALTNADDNAKKAPLYAQAGRAYEQFNAKLESNRKGEKRWGLAWLPESEAKQKIATWQKQEAALDKVRSKLAGAAAEVTAARRNLNKIKSQSMLGGVNRAMVDRAEDRLATAQRAYATAREEYRGKDAAVARPQFPQAMATVALHDVEPPAPGRTSEPFERPTELATATAAHARLRLRARPAPAPAPRVQPNEIEKADSDAPAAPELFVKRDISRRTVVRKAGAFPVAPDLYLTAASAVQGAKEITLSDTGGRSFTGEVLRVDAEAGVALVRSPGRKSPAYLRLADDFKGGAVQCVSLSPGLFDSRVEQIPGTLRLAGGEPDLSLQREPRRCGTPLVVNGQIVAVQLADRGLGTDGIPVATLDALKALCAANLPPPAATYADPAQYLYELVAVCETK
jgi:Tfp pilus assembly protein PilF